YIVQRLPLINGVIAETDDLSAVENCGGVIYENTGMTAQMDKSRKTVNRPRGYTGRGITVCVLDTGAEKTPDIDRISVFKDFVARIEEDEEHRKQEVETIFPYYNLRDVRSLYDGIAMYYLALLCYEKVDIAYAPTFKRAMISIRLAWLCKDLDKACPDHNYDYISQVFYRKALFFYQQTLINETGRIESIEPIQNFGPDMDKNYGYDGVIYLCGLLEYRYGQRQDGELRLKKLDEYKRAIARIFGLGKSSKAKPGPLLDTAKDLYDKISAELTSSNVFSDQG
ncbi:MAG: DUF2225 domain-containing protein, partial [Treponema sp.]|nr:DUF2225 domain-containing protein [Treponema sp.]